MSKKKQNLSDMINELPSRDIGNKDLKALLLQLVLDTPNDDVDGIYATRASVKLQALKILAEINKAEKDTDSDNDLIDLLVNRKKG